MGQSLSILQRLAAPIVRDPALFVAGTATLGIRLGGMALSFVLGVLLARVLQPEGLGTYGVVLAVATVLGVAAQLGLTTVATRETAVAMLHRDGGRLRSVRSIPTVVLLVAALLSLLLLGVGAAWQATGHALDPELAWAAVLCPPLAVSAVLTAIIRGFDKVVLSQALDILVRPGLLCAGCLILFVTTRSLNPAQVLALNAVAAGLVALAAFLIVHLQLKAQVEAEPAPRKAPHDWVRSGLPFAAVDLLKQLEASLSLLVLGGLAASAEAGLFRVAMSTMIFVAAPISVFQVVLTPTLARLHAGEDKGGLQDLMALTAVLMTTGTAALLLIIGVVGEGLLGTLFGSEYEGSWLPLMLLTGAQLANALGGCGWVLLGVGGGETALMRSYLVAVPVGLALAILLGHGFGASGVAAALLLTALIQNYLVWHSVRQGWGIDSSAFALVRRQGHG